tara:strand:+ start:285 stop:503 length:219 start_codon:yes stop_codon:yes gene_type:complete
VVLVEEMVQPPHQEEHTVTMEVLVFQVIHPQREMLEVAVVVPEEMLIMEHLVKEVMQVLEQQMSMHLVQQTL